MHVPLYYARCQAILGPVPCIDNVVDCRVGYHQMATALIEPSAIYIRPHNCIDNVDNAKINDGDAGRKTKSRNQTLRLDGNVRECCETHREMAIHCTVRIRLRIL